MYMFIVVRNLFHLYFTSSMLKVGEFTDEIH